MTQAKPRTSLRWIATAALLLVALSGCSTVKNLLDGRGKDHSTDPAKLVAITQSANVSQLWSASIGKGEEKLGIGQRPVIASGRVYAAAAEGGVSAFDLRSGQSLWRYPSELVLSGGPGAGDGLVVVGGLEGDVIALDAGTGAERWQAKVSNEVLVAPAIGGGIYSPDVPSLTVRGSGAMTIGPGMLFVGNDNGTLVALSMSDGNVVWTTPVAEPDGRSELERMADVDGPAILDNTTLYATSYKNHTVAIDGPSGQLMWDRDNGGPRGLGVSSSAVVVTDPSGNVWGLDRNTGGSLWQQNGLAYRKVTAPAVQGDYAVVGDFEGALHWLRLNDGAFAARMKLGGAISGQPAVEDGVLVVQTTEGQLAAFALQ